MHKLACFSQTVRTLAVLGVVVVVGVLSGCASGPTPPAWESNAQSALQTASAAYLTGNTRVEEQDFARALRELRATGRADLVATAELTRCATRAASLVFDDCPAYLPLAADAGAEQRAYADYLAGRWQGLNAALLPGHHAAVVANPATAAALSQTGEPLSRLVAAGMLLKHGNLSQPALDEVARMAVQTASSQAWRRPLLAWLGVQLKSAEAKGDATQVASLKRRVDLILNTAAQKP
jgi:hypothetical protein